MSVIANLIENKFIKSGTWVGINNTHPNVTQRYVVESFTQDGQIVAIDTRNMAKVKFKPDLVAEIDGMKLDRFLQQADLNSQGVKITGIKRRGRRPRVRI